MCTARLQTVGWKTAKRFPPRPSRFGRGQAVGKLRVAHPTGSPLREAPVGGALAATLLPSLLSCGTAALSPVGSTGFALHGDSLFFARAKKSKQKKARPNIRVWSLRNQTSLAPAPLRGSSRRGVPAPSFLARHPCLAPPCATPPLGLLTGSRDRVVCGLASERTVGWVTRSLPIDWQANGQGPGKSLHMFCGGKCCAVFHPTSTSLQPTSLRFASLDARAVRRRQTPLSVGRAQVMRKGLSGMDAAKAAMGQGWPFAAGPWIGTEAREPRRSRGRMTGQDFLVPFGATAKRDSPSRAKPMLRPTRPIGVNPKSPSPQIPRPGSLTQKAKPKRGVFTVTSKVPQC